MRTRPPRLLYCLAVWSGVGLFFVGQVALSRFTYGMPQQVIPGALLPIVSCWYWALVTPPIWVLSARIPFDRMPIRATLVHVPMAAAALLLDAVVEDYIVLPAVLRPVRPFFRAFIDLVYTDSLSYFGIVALEHVRRFQARSAADSARAARLESDLRQARLQALEAQLRPHFLFNALNTISSLVRGGQGDSAVRAVAALGDVLRGSLRQTEPEVSLHEELTLAQRYLDLERARFGEAVSFSVEADATTAKALVPSLVLQPLVENALKHGRGGDGRASIAIRARRSGDTLYLEVQDAGPGPLPGAPEGIGLSNTRARLEQLYGPRGSLDLRAAPGGGALAVVILPLREAAHG